MDNDSDKKKSTLGNLLLGGALLGMGSGSLGKAIARDSIAKQNGHTLKQRLLMGALRTIPGIAGIGLGYNRLKKGFDDGDENAKKHKASKFVSNTATVLYSTLAALNAGAGYAADKYLKANGATKQQRIGAALLSLIPAAGATWAAYRKNRQAAMLDDKNK